MATITRSDIRTHVIDTAIGRDFDIDTIDRIEAEIFEVAPLVTWRMQGLAYESDLMEDETFWGIVERVGSQA